MKHHNCLSLFNFLICLQFILLNTLTCTFAGDHYFRRLQREVAGLTQDIKNLREELQKTQLSKDNFKKKAQEYCLTLEELTSILSSKVSLDYIRCSTYWNKFHAKMLLKFQNSEVFLHILCMCCKKNSQRLCIVGVRPINMSKCSIHNLHKLRSNQ